MTIERSDVDGQVLWTLVRAAYRAERMLTGDLAEVALSPIQFGVLSQLAVESSVSNAELARLCFVRPQTMAGVVDGMAARDLVRDERRCLLSEECSGGTPAAPGVTSPRALDRPSLAT